MTLSDVLAVGVDRPSRSVSMPGLVDVVVTSVLEMNMVDDGCQSCAAGLDAERNTEECFSPTQFHGPCDERFLVLAQRDRMQMLALSAVVAHSSLFATIRVP